MRQAVADELARLRVLEGIEDADAAAIQQAFRNIATFAAAGELAAGWCRD